MLLAVGAPHVAGGADHRRHRGVDDDVARDVEVGDALVGVHHGQARTVGDALVDRRPDLVAVGQGRQAVEDAAEPVVGREARRRQVGAVALEDLREEGPDDVAEDDRVADLHHRGLEVHGEEHVLGLGTGDLLSKERVEGSSVHDGGVDDLALEHGHPVLERSGRTVAPDVPDREGVVAPEHHGLLVGAEVVPTHGRDVGLAVTGPCAHRVRVPAS